MGVLYYVAGRWMKVPAAKLVWSLTPGREGLSGLPHHKKPAQSGLTEGWVIYPPYRMGVPSLTMKHLYVVVLLSTASKKIYYVLKHALDDIPCTYLHIKPHWLELSYVIDAGTGEF